LEIFHDTGTDYYLLVIMWDGRKLSNFKCKII